MRKIIVLVLFFIVQTSFSQHKADDIVGSFFTPESDGVMQFYKTGTTYAAKLIWGKDKERIDTKNPNTALRGQKVIGMVLAQGFVFDGKGTWKNGTIYDPNEGKTYDCKLVLDEKNNMKLRGYIGISLLGRTAYMVRMEEKDKKE
jgi:uncharacterized protein (DUF2147 family)